MRVLLLIIAACNTDVVAPNPDAGSDATWPCYFWNGPTRCAPKCANKTLLGRVAFGEGNTCEYASGQLCETANMTDTSSNPGAGCCVVAGDRVDFYGCM